jgi:hypothetical protein
MVRVRACTTHRFESGQAGLFPFLRTIDMFSGHVVDAEIDQDLLMRSLQVKVRHP